MSISLSKVSSALSQEPHAGAVNAAEPFTAHDEASKMRMLPVEELHSSSGKCVLGVSLPPKLAHASSTRVLLGRVRCWQAELLAACLD